MGNLVTVKESGAEVQIKSGHQRIGIVINLQDDGDIHLFEWSAQIR